MKTANRLFSSFVLFAMLVVSAVVYICPMNMPRLSMSADHSGCGTGQQFIQNGGFGSFDCMGTHIANAKASLGQVIEIVNLLVVLTVVFVVLRVRNLFGFAFRSALMRLRQFYERYSTTVKIFWEASILNYLNLVRSTSVAS